MPAAVCVEALLLELARALPDHADGVEILVDCEPRRLAVSVDGAGQIEACCRHLLASALTGARAREIDLSVRADLRGETPMIYLSMRKILAATGECDSAIGPRVHSELHRGGAATRAVLLARRDGRENRFTVALEIPFAVHPEPAPSVGPPVRVLVSDANPRARRVLRRQLERRGFEVAEAGRAIEVIAAIDPLAGPEPPDWVLIDEGLLRSADAGRGLLAAVEAVVPAERIRLLSNRRARRAGGARCLAKPVGSEDLQLSPAVVSVPDRNAAAERPYSLSL